MDNNKSFYKTKPRVGISLIVLVITLIVIMILATAVIVSISYNNPISEANIARFESDRDNMQSILSMTVAKIAAKKQGIVKLREGLITNDFVIYSVENAADKNNSSGNIIFGKGKNSGNNYYIGKKLPEYKSGETNWYIGKSGEIALKVGDKTTGNAEYTEDLTLVEAFQRGHIKVGDYLNYNDFLNSSSASITLHESETGVAYDQTYNVDKNINWRVLGLDKSGKRLMLISGTPMFKDYNKPLEQNNPQNNGLLYLLGPVAAYNTCEHYVGKEGNILNKICKIYDSSIEDEIRSIHIDDINYLLGLYEDKEKGEVKKIENDSIIAKYSGDYSYKSGEYSPVNYLIESYPDRYKENYETGFIKNDNKSVIKVTRYRYNFEDILPLEKNTLMHELLFKNVGGKYSSNKSFCYWITSNVTDSLNFGAGNVSFTNINSSNGFIGTFGTKIGQNLNVRPIIFLKPNILEKDIKIVQKNNEEEINISQSFLFERIKDNVGKIK